MVLIALAALSMTGCKENKWADWKVQNEVWLENNKKQPGVVETSSGLQYKIISDPMANNGEPQPNTTSVIYCDYTVKLINGYVVESNHYVGIDLSSTIPG